MARARLISRSLSTSARFNVALPRQASKGSCEFAQLLYVLLIPHTDDWGRMDGDPDAIRLEVLPASRRPAGDFAKALRALHDVGLLNWYQVDGHKFLQIINFEHHQAGLHKRTRSRIPEPPGDSGNVTGVPPEMKLNRKEVEVEREGAEAPIDPLPSQPTGTDGADDVDAKVQLSPLVWLRPSEHRHLLKQFGEAPVRWMIEKLDDYKGKGRGAKQYSDDNRAIRSWVIKAWRQEAGLRPGEGPGAAPPPAPKPLPPIPRPVPPSIEETADGQAEARRILEAL